MNIVTPNWVKEAVFYQIFPDRFARSARVTKPSNLEDWNSPPTCRGIKGGDLYGIIEHLDYLKDLGINSIFLNPIFSGTSNHRYHTYSYFEVDTILGGNAAFRELLNVAHEKGFRVILDGVFNHTGRGFYQFVHTLENGINSPYIDWFHFNYDQLKNGHINPYDGNGNHGYKCWWNIPDLPKLNTSNPQVREYLFSIIRFWTEYGIDGWRLDVPSEIDDDSFWQEFRHIVKGINPDAYIVGEIWDEAQRWLQGDQFDGVMNYQLYNAIKGFFRNDNQMNSSEFAGRVHRVLECYPQEITYSQLNLIGSHDTERFLTGVNGDVQMSVLAHLFMIMFPGAPCIFYGDEIGLTGGKDPECRKAFDWNTDMDNCYLRNKIKEFIAIRQSNEALQKGSFIELYSQDGLYAFSRGDAVTVVLNTRDRQNRFFYNNQEISVCPRDYLILYNQ